MYAELVYFDKAHFAHIVAYEERKLLTRIAEANASAFRSRERLGLRFGASR